MTRKKTSINEIIDTTIETDGTISNETATDETTTDELTTDENSTDETLTETDYSLDSTIDTPLPDDAAIVQVTSDTSNIEPPTDEELEELLTSSKNASTTMQEIVESRLEAEEREEEEAEFAKLRAMKSEGITEAILDPEPEMVKEAKRIIINYGNRERVDKYERAYLAMSAAIENKTILTGTVIQRKTNTLTDRETGKKYLDITMLVYPDNEELSAIPIWISADNMSRAIRKTDRVTIEANERSKIRFGKAMLGSNIEFCVTHVIALSPKERDYANQELTAIGSRVMANDIIRSEWVENMENPDRVEAGSIVNGKIVAVYSTRILFSVAGIDLFLGITVPYITGLSPVQDTLGGKRLFNRNEERLCKIERIGFDDNGNVTNLRVSFYEPLRDEIDRKVRSINEEDMLLGQILRYTKSGEGDNARMIVIVKANVGVEVACPMPGWKTPPLIGMLISVQVKRINPDNRLWAFVKRP